MSTLFWSEELALGLAPADAAHRELIDLLAQVESSTDRELLCAWRQLIMHTNAHFADEDRWMQDTGFAPGNCHARQHLMAMRVLRDAERRGLDGDLAHVRLLAREFATWLPQHVRSMDVALAEHLNSVAYDPITRSIGARQALPAQALSSCGGRQCSDDPDPASAAACSHPNRDPR